MCKKGMGRTVNTGPCHTFIPTLGTWGSSKFPNWIKSTTVQEAVLNLHIRVNGEFDYIEVLELYPGVRLSLKTKRGKIKKMI